MSEEKTLIYTVYRVEIYEYDGGIITQLDSFADPVEAIEYSRAQPNDDDYTYFVDVDYDCDD